MLENCMVEQLEILKFNGTSISEQLINQFIIFLNKA